MVAGMSEPVVPIPLDLVQSGRDLTEPRLAPDGAQGRSLRREAGRKARSQFRKDGRQGGIAGGDGIHVLFSISCPRRYRIRCTR